MCYRYERRLKEKEARYEGIINLRLLITRKQPDKRYKKNDLVGVVESTRLITVVENDF
jgi:hypothetical protein